MEKKELIDIDFNPVECKAMDGSGQEAGLSEVIYIHGRGTDSAADY